MFGYIRLHKPELKMKDYEVYRSVYCSLCKELGREFGLLARLTLSYDFTFLAILKIAASETCPNFQKSRCSFNLLKKCQDCTNDSGAIAFSAATAMIMTYYKLRDDISDKSFCKKLPLLAVYPIIALAHNKAVRLQPQVEEIISQAMVEQKRLEKDKCRSIDVAAEPTARALSHLISFDAKDETQHRILERLGYCIGRYVYIMDAADDIKKDLKTGEYNPFVLKFKLKKENGLNSLDDSKKNHIENILNLTIDEAIKAFELLAINRYHDIIRNILYDGLYNTMKEVLWDCPAKAKVSADYSSFSGGDIP